MLAAFLFDVEELMKKGLNIVLSLIIAIFVAFKFGIIVGKNKDILINKYKQYFKLMCRWEEVSDKKLEAFFLNREIEKVGVYGNGDIGIILAKKLSNTQIKVEYFVEKSKKINSSGIKTYSIDDPLPEVDAIIVTPFTEYKSIELELNRISNCKIISIEEVIVNEAI